MTGERLATALPPVVADTIPWSNLATDAQKEAHEGELMTPQGTFTVTDNFDANFFGSFTLAAGDTPLRQPTDAGAAGSAQAQAVAPSLRTRAAFGSDAMRSLSATSGWPLAAAIPQYS